MSAATHIITFKLFFFKKKDLKNEHEGLFKIY